MAHILDLSRSKHLHPNTAGNISNIKYQPPKCDQESKKETKTRKNFISNILRPVFTYTYDPPDIYLRPDVQQDRNKNYKSKTCE
jgi:hypothetical protein